MCLSCFLYLLVLEKQGKRVEHKRDSQGTREIVQNNFTVLDALAGQIIASALGKPRK